MPSRFPDASAAADLAACRALLRDGSRTFLAASRLLPAGVRDPACALYAFCRVADDSVDQAEGPAAAVARLRTRLDLIYAGRPQPAAADRALARTVQTFGIPRALPEALLEGFAWDAAGRRYRDMADLEHYAARVAGSVGAMMALIMGARSPDAVARASDLGVAMQLSNIARDVGEDARARRVYLPLTLIADAGIDLEAWLRAPAFEPALGEVVRRLLDRADALYRRAEAGIGALPWSCRPAIWAARVLYAEIGSQVRRNGYDSVTRRAVVPGRRKARLLVTSLVGSARSHDGIGLAALEANRFLVEAVRAAAPVPAPGPRRPMRPMRVPLGFGLDARVANVIELFARLEQRDRRRAMTAAGPSRSGPV